MKHLQKHPLGKRIVSFLLAVSCLCSAAAPGTVYALEGADTSIQQTVNDQTTPDGNTDPSGNSTPDGNTNPDGNAAPDGNTTPDGNTDPSGNTNPDGNADPEGDVTPGGGVETFSLVESKTDAYWTMGTDSGPELSFICPAQGAEDVKLEVTFPQGMVLALGEGTDWTLDEDGTLTYGGTKVATLTATGNVTLKLDSCSYTLAATTEENSTPASLKLTFTCTPLTPGGDQDDGNGEGTTGSDDGVQPLDNKEATITFQLEPDVLNSTGCTLRKNDKNENYDYGTLGFTVMAGESIPVSQNLRVVPTADTTQVVAQDGTAQYVVGYLDHQGKAIAQQETPPTFTLTYTVTENGAPIKDENILKALEKAILAALGENLTDLPTPTVTSGESTYTATAENLPTKIWLADDQDGGTTYTINWNIDQTKANYGEKYKGYTPDELAAASITTDLESNYYYVQAEQQGYEPSKDVTINSYATLEHKVYWADNNNEAAKRPTALDGLYELQFALDGKSDYKTLTQSDLAALGMTDMPALTGDIKTPYEMTLAAPEDTLPAKITYTYYDTEGEEPAPETHTVSWQLVTKDTANYQRVEVTKEDLYKYPSVKDNTGTYYVLLFTYEFTLQLRRGGTALGAGLRYAFLQGFDLNITYGSNTMKRTLAVLDEEGSVTLDYDQTDAHPDKIEVSIANGWRYNLDNSVISYVVKQNGDSGESGKLHPKAEAGAENAIPEGDWFAISYDNSAVPNHGSATDGVYSGGKMYLTLAGNTEYQATKIWLDEKPNTRPENVEVELWRYTQRNDRNYNNAAPVRDDSGSILSLTLQGKELTGTHKEYIVFKDGDYPITLPKYDSEGYLYIYGAREYLTGNYEQIFGEPERKIDSNTPELDVTFEDTLPEGVTSRASGDTFVYNKGTLCNRIVGSTTMSVTKQWKAAAFQSEFKGVEVTFALQAKLMDETGEEYTTTDNTLSMGNFYAENLTYTDSMTVSQYDDLGRELTYQWIEQGVKQNGTEVPSDNTDGNRTFTLVQAERQVEYTSTGTVDENDPNHTVIVNEISNVIDFAVEKRWTAGTTPAEAKFTLFRTVNGSEFKKYLTFTMAPDGNGVKVEITEPVPDKVTVNDVQSETPTGDDVALWKAVLENIPEFDKDGNQYEYILLENSGAGYSATSITTERDEITGNYSSKVVNGHGDGNVILVTKQWIDESDVQHRLPVTLTVYERDTNNYVTEVTLGDDGNWYALVGIGEHEPEDVYVLETKVGKTEINQNIEPPTEYKESENGEDVKYTRVPFDTQYHKYEATYTSKKILGYTTYNVINRRLGEIDVTVNVTWKDGDGTARSNLKAALEAAGLSFALQLDFDDSAQVDQHPEYEITYTSPSIPDTVTLTGEGGKVAILDGEGKRASSVRPLDLSDATQTIQFCDLPKYNTTGGAVRYTVAPVFVDADGKIVDISEGDTYKAVYEAYKEYAEIYGDWKYTVGDKHAEDYQNVDITYKLSGSIDPIWYCRWKDAYVYENGARPDLYLDIYRVSNNGTPQEVVTNYRWAFQEPEADDEDSQFVNESTFWKATITGMPKYDEDGYKYTYYAIERTDVVAADFSYLPAKYGLNMDREGQQVFGSRTEAPKDEHKNLVRVVQTGETTEYALQAGNTFINTISGNITVEGRKYWQNLPAGYPADDLPGVKFMLTGTSKSPDTGEPEIRATLTVDKEQWVQMKNGVYQLKLAYVGDNVLQINGDGTVEAKPAAGNTQATPLPRFDSEGYLYKYEITSEDIQFVEGSEAEGNKDLVYDVDTSGFLTKGEVYNTYAPQKGSLTAVKYLKIRNDLTAYPSVVLQLTRTYTTNEDKPSKPETVETKVWSAEDIEEAVAEKEGTGEVVVSRLFTFENLPKYAPNGSEYIYTITEDNTYLGGYASAAYGTGAPDENNLDSVFQALAEGNAPTPEPLDSLSVGGLTPYSSSVDNPDATFLNVRLDDQKKVSLTIQKQWYDWDNVFGVRPDKIEITIYRYTDKPPASYQGQKIDPEPLTGYEDTPWSPTDKQGNLWQLTIEGLERYAPNGMPWKYKVVENEDALDEHYTAVTATVTKGATDADGNITMNPLVNSMQTSASFQKQWVDSDGNPITGDSLGGLKLSVDFTLQVREEEGDTKWEDASSYFARELNTENYNKIFVSGGKEYQFTQTLTDVLGASSWNTTKYFSGLPKAIRTTDSEQDAPLTELSYRVVECEIRVYAADATPGTDKPLMTQTVKVEDTADGNSYTYDFGHGLFRPYYNGKDSRDSTDTTHWNQLETTEFEVTKTWADDNNNLYGTRPKGNATGNKTWEVTFVIQRSTDGGTTWTNVKDANDKDRTVTLTGINENESLSEKVTGLPRSILDATGKVVLCTYRARELDGSTLVGDGGTAYNGVYTVEYNETGLGAVTNRLRTTQFTAEKQWIIGDGSTKPDITLELKYLASDGKTWKSFATPAKVVLDGEEDKNPAKPYYETSKGDKWTAIWTDVPLVLPNSTRDESGHTRYKVVETAVNGYVTIYKPDTANNNTVITNTKLVNIEVPVTKIWLDADNAMGDRPASVTFVLYADNVEIQRKTLTAPTGLAGLWNRLTGQSNIWTGTFTGLPKYDSKDGHEIVYTVKEEPVPDHYVATVDDTTLTVTNTRNGNLLVEKVVTGTDGETNRAFHFTVELSDKSVSGVHGGVTFTNGVAAFTLKSGDKVLIEDLPAGCTYTVTEAEANADGYTTVSQGAAGKIEAGQTATAQIENHRDAAPRPTPSPTPDPEEETTGTPGGTVLPQTSDDANLTALYVLLGLSAVGLAALAGYGIYRRKKGR